MGVGDAHDIDGFGGGARLERRAVKGLEAAGERAEVMMR